MIDRIRSLCYPACALTDGERPLNNSSWAGEYEVNGMSKTAKSEKKRNELVDQVIAMLHTFDFQEATVRKICEVTHISVGTFYHYFHEKNDLIAEILGRIDTYLAKQVMPRLTHEDEAVNLVEFGSGFAQYTNGIGSVTGSVISRTDFPLPSTPDTIRAEHERLLYTLPAAILRRGREKGQFYAELDVEEAVDQLIIALRGHAMEWSRRGRVYHIEEKVLSFMRLYCRMLKI